MGVSRDPQAPVRTRRGLGELASIINDLIQAGDIILVGPGEFALGKIAQRVTDLDRRPPAKYDDGEQGEAGPPGPPGADGQPGTPGVMIVFREDGEDGPMGPPGVKGDTGVNGAVGPFVFAEDGAEGQPGVPGATGATGVAGAVGPFVFAEDGADGSMGPPGVAGADGASGAAGAAGVAGPFVLADEVEGPMGPPGLALLAPFNTLIATDIGDGDTVPFYDATLGNVTAVAQRLAGYTSRFSAGGRLTLTTAVPVTISDVTAAGTLYYTPYLHNKIGIYDGTRWTQETCAEISLSLTLTSAKQYDVFIYSNAGTLTLELSAAWTDATTRVDALAMQDGIYVKSGAATRRWLGTIRASGTNTTEDSYTKRFVSNFYNRTMRPMFNCPGYSDGNTATTISITSTTFAAMNGGTNDLIEWVNCEASAVNLYAKICHVAPVAGNIQSGISFENATTGVFSVNGSSDTTFTDEGSIPVSRLFAAGYHSANLVSRVTTGTGTVTVDRARSGANADPFATYASGVLMG